MMPFAVFSQEVNTLFREAQRLEESRREAEALKKYQEVVRTQPTHIAALCKISELLCIIGSRQTGKPAKLQYFRSAKQSAETALKLNPNHSDANFVMSMAMGKMALMLSGQEKIKAVIDIKRYAESSVRNDPSNYKAYHVLGKWHFEVSSLNTLERMGVKFLFGGFPSSSFAESIRCYEKSRSINPAFALNYLEAAKAYHKNNQDNKAIELLKRLQSLPVKTTDDPQIRKEGNQLLIRLSSNV